MADYDVDNSDIRWIEELRISLDVVPSCGASLHLQSMKPHCKEEISITPNLLVFIVRLIRYTRIPNWSIVLYSSWITKVIDGIWYVYLCVTKKNYI